MQPGADRQTGVASTGRAWLRRPAQAGHYVQKKNFHRFVVIEFPTMEQAIACFESPEYQEAAAFRKDGGGVVENVIVEGGDATK